LNCQSRNSGGDTPTELPDGRRQSFQAHRGVSTFVPLSMPFVKVNFIIFVSTGTEQQKAKQKKHILFEFEFYIT
jgi:hypothetical protein